MRVESFPHCCGIKILANFYEVDYGSDWENIKSKPCSPEAALNYLLQQNKLSYRKGINLVALNQQQYNALKDTMKKAGYRYLCRGWNAAHENYNYLFASTIKKPPKKKKTAQKRPYWNGVNNA